MSLAFAYVFFASGGLAEQVARLVPAVLAITTALATRALAVRWFGPGAGSGALLALAASPLFLLYAPNGFVDIPTGLFFVLTAYAADVWLETRRTRWALLAGACAGLALWTKQSAFFALLGAGIVFAAAIAWDLRAGAPRRALRSARDGLLALGVAVPGGGWWYLRNAWYDGWEHAFWVPSAFYTSQARPTLANLVPFVGQAGAFGLVTSAACLSGILWGLLRPRRTGWAFAWAVPYTLVWWKLYSYDARFLLTVLPFYASLFGGAALAWARPVPTAVRALLCAGVAAAAAFAVESRALGGLKQWLLAPRASYAERLSRVEVGGSYATAEYLRAHVPAGARIVTMDSRMPYYLSDRDIQAGYPIRMAELEGADYLVAAPWARSVYRGLGAADNEVLRAMASGALEKVFATPRDEYVVYRVGRR